MFRNTPDRLYVRSPAGRSRTDRVTDTSWDQLWLSEQIWAIKTKVHSSPVVFKKPCSVLVHHKNTFVPSLRPLFFLFILHNIQNYHDADAYVV